MVRHHRLVFLLQRSHLVATSLKFAKRYLLVTSYKHATILSSLEHTNPLLPNLLLQFNTLLNKTYVTNDTHNRYESITLSNFLKSFSHQLPRFSSYIVWYTERDYNIQANYKKLQITKSYSPFKLLSTS